MTAYPSDPLIRIDKVHAETLTSVARSPHWST